MTLRLIGGTIALAFSACSLSVEQLKNDANFLGVFVGEAEDALHLSTGIASSWVGEPHSFFISSPGLASDSATEEAGWSEFFRAPLGSWIVTLQSERGSPNPKDTFSAQQLSRMQNWVWPMLETALGPAVAQPIVVTNRLSTAKIPRNWTLKLPMGKEAPYAIFIGDATFGRPVSTSDLQNAIATAVHEALHYAVTRHEKNDGDRVFATQAIEEGVATLLDVAVRFSLNDEKQVAHATAPGCTRLLRLSRKSGVVLADAKPLTEHDLALEPRTDAGAGYIGATVAKKRLERALVENEADPGCDAQAVLRQVFDNFLTANRAALANQGSPVRG